MHVENHSVTKADRLAIEQEAARLVQLLDSTDDKGQRRSVFAWIDKSPYHAVAFATAQDTWRKSARVILPIAADPGVQPDLGDVETVPSVRSVPFLSRRQLVGGFAAAASVAAAIGIGSLKPWQDRRSTAHGERSVAKLADGSAITLNGETTLDIDLQKERRLVRMVRGEALFDIARDKSRPFIIDLDRAQVEVLGTKFNIRKLDDSIELAVTEGLVAASSNGKVIHLPAGYTAVFRPGGPLTGLHAPDLVAHRLSWYEGFMQFDNEPLSQVVSEFNRYRNMPIFIGDPRIQSTMITGRFGLDESDAFVSALASSFGIHAVSGEDGGLTLVRAGEEVGQELQP
jgi:transmembrane sensor